MAYQFANSLEARAWLREYCVRHELSWLDLVAMMDRTTPWRSTRGQWVPFASKLYFAEQAAGSRKPQVKQPTLQPQLGPILSLIQRMTSEEELRDYLATLLFDEIVTLATAVKQKRSSRGKRVQGKARQVQKHQPASGDEKPAE